MKEDFRQNVFGIIQSLIGHLNILTIPKEFIHFTGDIDSALLLSQLVYWSGKTKDPEGWVYKTYADWEEETSLTERQIRRIKNVFEDIGFLETKVAKANGNPTVHYRINQSKFIDSFLTFLTERSSKKESNDPVKKKESITENTTETTTETFLKEKINTPHGVVVDRKLFNKPSNSVKPKKPFEPSDRSINIIDHWNSKNGLRFHKTGTQLYKDISNRIDDLYNGKLKSDLFKEKTTFQRKDFIEAINQFHLSATHLDYEPLKSSYKEYLQKMSLFDFLYNPSAPTDKNKSLFFHFLNNPAQKVNGGHGAVRTRKSDLPAISILSEWYKNHAVNPNGNGVYHFGLAVQRLKEYAKLHAHEFHPSLDYWRQCYVGADELSFLAMVLTEAIEDEMIQADKDGRPIQLTSGWLCSDRTFEVRLPKYLSKKNFIKGEYRI